MFSVQFWSCPLLPHANSDAMRWPTWVSLRLGLQLVGVPTCTCTTSPTYRWSYHRWCTGGVILNTSKLLQAEFSTLHTDKSSLEHTPHLPWWCCCCSSSMASCLVYQVVQHTSSDFMRRPLPVLILSMRSGTSMHMELIGVVDRRGQWKCTICSGTFLYWKKWLPLLQGPFSVYNFREQCKPTERNYTNKQCRGTSVV